MRLHRGERLRNGPALTCRLGAQGQCEWINPRLIIEILSEPTEAYDRGKKFLAYQSIESFEEYLLMAQDKPYVTHYVRQADGAWLRSDIEGLDKRIDLVTIPRGLTLSELYAVVEFSAA